MLYFILLYVFLHQFHSSRTTMFLSVICNCIYFCFQLPAPFDLEVALEKFPVSYTESMNTVLIQEMERYNKLLAAMYSDLEALMKAIKGFTIMSPALEAISSSLVIGKVPESWTKVSYPSLKPLASYVADFLERIKFLEVRKHVSISVTFSHLVNTVLTTAASREQMTILK